MKSKKHREPPEFETIQAAIEGDARSNQSGAFLFSAIYQE